MSKKNKSAWSSASRPKVDDQASRVTELEAQLFDARANDRHRSLKAGVDDDMALARSDEISRKPLGADIVEIVGDAMRRE